MSYAVNITAGSLPQLAALVELKSAKGIQFSML